MYANLKLQIFKSGLHQNHLARELRIDETLLSKIIHGFREPNEILRKRLAEYLGVDENWLFERFDGHLDGTQSNGETPHLTAKPESSSKLSVPEEGLCGCSGYPSCSHAQAQGNAANKRKWNIAISG